MKFDCQKTEPPRRSVCKTNSECASSAISAAVQRKAVNAIRQTICRHNKLVQTNWQISDWMSKRNHIASIADANAVWVAHNFCHKLMSKALCSAKHEELTAYSWARCNCACAFDRHYLSIWRFALESIYLFIYSLVEQRTRYADWLHLIGIYSVNFWAYLIIARITDSAMLHIFINT